MMSPAHVGGLDLVPDRIELDPGVFDELAVSIDVADEAPALRDRLASVPRLS